MVLSHQAAMGSCSALRDFESKTGVISGEWLWGSGVIGKRWKKRGQERCRMRDQQREGKEEPE